PAASPQRGRSPCCPDSASQTLQLSGRGEKPSADTNGRSPRSVSLWATSGFAHLAETLGNAVARRAVLCSPRLPAPAPCAVVGSPGRRSLLLFGRAYPFP